MPARETTVVNYHPHDFEFFTESPGVGPAIDRLEPKHSTTWPSGDVQLALVRRECVSLSVVAELTAIGPLLTVKPIDSTAIVAGRVEMSVMDGQ